MSAAVFPFCVGFVLGGGLSAITLHVFALRWMFTEARKQRASQEQP